MRRRIGRAKQFWNAAIDSEQAEKNPFTKLSANVRGNRERFQHVTVEDAEKVLDACPNLQWRLVFALARFGGIRTPSETFALTWEDVDWESNRVLIRSPKTEHHEGKGSRVIPLFPELLPLLREAWDAAPEGATHVVTIGRDAKMNLRTGLQRIIERAKVTPWPKLFHNLRASRQTELAQQFPIHVVCEWLGNSKLVAAEHYLRVTDGDFARALTPRESGAESGAQAVQKAVQPVSASKHPNMTATTPAIEENQAKPGLQQQFRGDMHACSVVPVRLERTAFCV
ncbi:MAG: site-specific integrase [Planctomyces sp.]|nr:site-specific integrase [Planctomyces sp.]